MKERRKEPKPGDDGRSGEESEHMVKVTLPLLFTRFKWSLFACIYGERKMTKRNKLWMWLAIMALVPSVAFFPGCTKKSALKNEIMVTREQKPLIQLPAEAVTDDKGTKESKPGDQVLREQTLMDQADRGSVPTSARMEASGKEAAILEELRIPDIHFDLDEYTLKPENQAILKGAARAYLKYTNYKLVIEGHCDERGTAEYNLALGQKRADEAAKFLIALGIAKERIKTISYGKERPLDHGHDETALAKNRRDHFVVSQSVK
jgi:peptidoglycan-associated lipoprotein